MTQGSNEMLSLSGKRILVTGASSGIGREVALLAGRLGATVCCVARDPARMKETVDQLAGSGHVFRLFDLNDHEGIPRLIYELKPLDGLVHAAGIQQTIPFRLLSVEQLRKTTSVNSEAGLVLARCFQNKDVCKGPTGSIVYVSSILARVGAPGVVAYSFAKGALEGMTRSLALELAPRRIRVNCLAPGYVRTPMLQDMERVWSQEHMRELESLHPLGLGTAEDVAAAAAFLLADCSRWITGTVLTVDGGYTAR